MAIAKFLRTIQEVLSEAREMEVESLKRFPRLVEF
jgi:hypothetical protein